MDEDNLNSDFDDEITEYYDKMGYSYKPLYEYSTDDDIMDYPGYSEYAKIFNLKRSTILKIITSIKQSAAYHRTSKKSMMATISSTIIPPEDNEELKGIFKEAEALIQTRQTHMEEVAALASQISNGIGANEYLANAIGLEHDIGHAWNGHTGERILSSLSRLYNCGYIVHNAMGAYVSERERIIETAIDGVKRINPSEREEDIREFMRYVIDGVVSHNGEGVIGRIVPIVDKTNEDMEREIKKCFTEKGFDKTIMPATLEGAIIRYADIIAYTRSDILDGFRLKDINGNKILDDFDDEYLSIIGTVLARQNNLIKALTLENKFLLEMYKLSQRIEKLSTKEAKNSAENILELKRTKKERQIIETVYREFEKRKIQYAKRYINKIHPKSAVKTEITQMMSDIFVKDLIEASKDKGYITMSPLMRKTLFSLRDLNIRRIVPYTRRAFETTALPSASKEFIDMLSNVILETGLAYKMIPKAEKANVRPFKSEEEWIEKAQELENNSNLNFERKVYHFYKNQSAEKLKYMYENVIDAMRDIAKHDIEIAIGEEEYDGELKELYETEKISRIKIRIGEMGKNSETITRRR